VAAKLAAILSHSFTLIEGIVIFKLPQSLYWQGVLQYMAKKGKSGFQSAAGLIRYFEEEKTGVKIDPRFIIVFTIATVVVITALKILYPV